MELRSRVKLSENTASCPPCFPYASVAYFCPSDEITSSFRRFGHLVVDWPHKAESKSYFPPKGTAGLSMNTHPWVVILSLDGVKF